MRRVDVMRRVDESLNPRLGSDIHVVLPTDATFIQNERYYRTTRPDLNYLTELRDSKPSNLGGG
jgi:hypothetical protein